MIWNSSFHKFMWALYIHDTIQHTNMNTGPSRQTYGHIFILKDVWQTLKVLFWSLLLAVIAARLRIKSHICANSLHFFFFSYDFSFFFIFLFHWRSPQQIPETNTTVLDLKKAIKRNYELNQKRLANREHRNIGNTIGKCPKQKLQNHQQSQKSGRSHSSNRDHADHNITNISWRYIWRTYHLDFDGNALANDQLLLSHYGVRNKSILRFVKKIKYIRRERKEKNQKRSWSLLNCSTLELAST